MVTADRMILFKNFRSCHLKVIGYHFRLISAVSKTMASSKKCSTSCALKCGKAAQGGGGGGGVDPGVLAKLEEGFQVKREQLVIFVEQSSRT